MCSGYTEVFSWGGDHYGQLGQPAKSTSRTTTAPKLTNFNVFIREISCGEDHAAFITQEGQVYTLGSNADGRLGVGNRTIKVSNCPLKVDSLGAYQAVTLSCGWTHTAVLTDTGEVYAWGNGDTGALGVGSTDTQWLPTLVRLPRDLTPVSVSCGARHSVIVGNSRGSGRETWTCGCGEAGQLGTGRRDKELTYVRISTPETISQASCGVFHTGLLSTTGRVYTMGGNSFGQLGIGSKKSSSTPQCLTSLDRYTISKISCGSHSSAISDRGELFIWGSGPFGELLTPQLVEMPVRVMDVCVGGTFAAVIDVNHSVWTWGSNTSGELGVGDYDQRSSPNLVPTLQGKQVRTLACGVSFCIALGQDCGNSEEDVAPKQTSRPSSRLGDRIKTSKAHIRAATATTLATSKSPLRPRNRLSTLEPPDRDVSKSFHLGENISISNELSRKNSELLTKIEDLHHQLNIEHEKVTRLESLLLEERSKHELTLSSERQRLTKDLQDFQTNANSSLFELQTALQSKEKEVGIIRKTCQEVVQEREKMGDLIEERDRKVEALIQELAVREDKFRENLHEKEQEINEIRVISNQNRTKYEEINSKLMKENEDLKYHCDSLIHQEAVFTSNIDHFKQLLSVSQAEIATQSSTITSLTTEITQLRDLILSKEDQTTTLKRDIELLNREKRTALGDLNQLQMLIVACEGETENAVREKEMAEKEIEMLRKKWEDAKKECEIDKRNFEELKVSSENLRQKLEFENKRKDEEIANFREKIQLIYKEKTELEENLRKSNREFESEKAKNRRLEDTLNQSKDRFQSDLTRKDDEKSRLIDSYDRKISTLNLEISDLKAKISRQEVDFRSIQEELSEIKGNKVDLAQKLLEVEVEKQALDRDLDSALGTIQGMEENNRKNVMKMEDLEDENRRFKLEIEDLKGIMSEEKGKRGEILSENRQLEDQIENLTRELKSALESSRLSELKLTSKLDSLQDDLRRSESRHEFDLQGKDRDLKATTEKLRVISEENMRLNSAMERLNEERNKAVKQGYELERLKRNVEEGKERLQTVSRRVEELRSRNADLEGKNRELYARLERNRGSPVPTMLIADLSPLRETTATFKPTDARISSGKWNSLAGDYSPVRSAGGRHSAESHSPS